MEIAIASRILKEFISKWDLAKDSTNSESTDFMIAGRGGDAVGCSLDGDEFVVHSGSRISPDETDGLQQGYSDLRKHLINQRVIQNNVFVSDYRFDSPSVSSCGGSTGTFLERPKGMD